MRRLGFSDAGATDAELRRAVDRAQTDALLALRDQELVNDQLHQQLQLQLDRANPELREAG